MIVSTTSWWTLAAARAWCSPSSVARVWLRIAFTIAASQPAMALTNASPVPWLNSVCTVVPYGNAIAVPFVKAMSWFRSACSGDGATWGWPVVGSISALPRASVMMPGRACSGVVPIRLGLANCVRYLTCSRMIACLFCQAVKAGRSTETPRGSLSRGRKLKMANLSRGRRLGVAFGSIR